MGFTRLSLTIVTTIMTAAVLFTGVGAAAYAAEPVSLGSGPLSGGTEIEVPIPNASTLPSGVSAVSVTAGQGFIVAIGSDARTYAWGTNTRGELGNGTTRSSRMPVAVDTPLGVTFTQVSAKGNRTVALGSDHMVYTWGSGQYGAIGDGVDIDRLVPTRVEIPGNPEIAQVAAGESHALALGTDGKLYGWGNNVRNQIGTPMITSFQTPVLIPFLPGITPVAISAGGDTSFARTSDGNVYAWGMNAEGQLGDATTTSRSRPVQVFAPAGVHYTDISAGYRHTIGLGDDGNAYVWGSNTNGVAGLVTTSSIRKTPGKIDMPGDTPVVAVSAGNGYSLVIGADGRIFGWGTNTYAQLGNGTVSSSPLTTTVAMPAGVRGAQIIAGGSASLAFDPSGQLYVWGSNANGEYANGTTTQQRTPVRAFAPEVTVQSITFDGVAGSGVSAIAQDRWRVTTPAHSAGAVDVSVQWSLAGVAQPAVVYPAGFHYEDLVTPRFIVEPVDAAAAVNETAVFMVQVAGDPEPNVSWQLSSDNGASWQDIAGDTSVTLTSNHLAITVVAHSHQNGYLFRAIAQNPAGSVESTAARIAVTGGETAVANAGSATEAGSSNDTEASASATGSTTAATANVDAGTAANAGGTHTAQGDTHTAGVPATADPLSGADTSGAGSSASASLNANNSAQPENNSAIPEDVSAADRGAQSVQQNTGTLAFTGGSDASVALGAGTMLTVLAAILLTRRRRNTTQRAPIQGTK